MFIYVKTAYSYVHYVCEFVGTARYKYLAVTSKSHTHAILFSITPVMILIVIFIYLGHYM